VARQCDRQPNPLAVVPAYRCDGQLARVVAGVQRPLGAIGVHALAEIFLLMEQFYPTSAMPRSLAALKWSSGDVAQFSR
jgi:hypothetical protein